MLKFKEIIMKTFTINNTHHMPDIS